MKKILSLFCFLLCACTSNPSTSNSDSSALNLKGFSLPNGIYYDGRIYWELDNEKKNAVQGNSLGTLQEVEQTNCFPVSDLVGTKKLKKHIGSEIYAKDDSLYLENEKETYVFQYIKESKEKREEIKSAEKYQDTEYAISHHFIYNDMLYSIYQSECIELPNNFKKVGKVEKTYVLANTNFTGNMPIGSILYANDFQNRFMIVKNSENDKYYLFENEVYKTM